MGKKEKKQRQQQRSSRRGSSHYIGQEDDDEGYNYQGKPDDFEQEPEEEGQEESEEEEDEETEENGSSPLEETPSKFLLYQQSVQSPKGDISYLQKFFLMYVGGRSPLHFQEDFCGTALLSAEWLRGDPRRTAVGLDLDLEALQWCMENNIPKVGADGYSRISLFHGNVLKPLEAKFVRSKHDALIEKIKLNEGDAVFKTSVHESNVPADSTAFVEGQLLKRDCTIPARDIVCAFNYSSCCLHKRADLVLYFKYVLNSLSQKGGIFVMDLYGGTSSEHKLRLQRRFPTFTYIWEQDEFDIIERKTRISLHFHLKKQQKKIRHAFSYSWRLWSLPEIKDSLEEAGFRSVRFWVKKMPDTSEARNSDGFGVGRNVKYEEVNSFQQQDAWNAYVIGIRN